MNNFVRKSGCHTFWKFKDDIFQIQDNIFCKDDPFNSINHNSLSGVNIIKILVLNILYKKM